MMPKLGDERPIPRKLVGETILSPIATEEAQEGRDKVGVLQMSVPITKRYEEIKTSNCSIEYENPADVRKSNSFILQTSDYKNRSDAHGYKSQFNNSNTSILSNNSITLNDGLKERLTVPVKGYRSNTIKHSPYKFSQEEKLRSTDTR